MADLRPTTELQFIIPFALPGLNARDRTHWAKRSKLKADLALEVLVALGGPRYFPRPAWDRVRVTVERRSSKRLDADNLVASVKPLLDVLRASSRGNPGSLGIIVDDSPDHLKLIVTQSIAAPRGGSTVVRIERLDAIIDEMPTRQAA